MNRLGIVGYGRFGRALATLAKERGLSVVASDPYVDGALLERDSVVAAPLAALVAEADVIVVATPVAAMRRVFEEMAPHVSAPAAREAPLLVMDVGSVKVGPAEALTVLRNVDAVATHPLFGPMSLAQAERPLTVVVCPAARDEATRRAERFWQDLGCETKRASPEEHDRVMARTHALAFFFAKGLLDAQLAGETAFAPPSFAMMARAVASVRADAGHLFRTVQAENPFAAEARSALLSALAAVDAELTGPVRGEGPSIEAGATTADPGGADATARARGALGEAREHIDEVDRELLRLLSRRAELAERARRAKVALGIPVRDPPREREVFATREAWARELGLDEAAVTDVMAAILRFSRAHQQG